MRGLSREVDRAILVISAMAPVTTEVTAYEYSCQVVSLILYERPEREEGWRAMAIQYPDVMNDLTDARQRFESGSVQYLAEFVRARCRRAVWRSLC